MKKIQTFLLLSLLSNIPLQANAQTIINGHAQTTPSANELQQILIENPELFTQIISKNPELFDSLVIDSLKRNKELLIDVIQQGAESKRLKEFYSQWKEDIKTPKKVLLKDRPTRGSEDAPVTIIAFSDFACSYCMQAAATVENLLQRYPNTRFVFKQFPSNSPAAQEASRWFLAAQDIDKKKGWNFYALLFSNQKSFFSNPTETLKKVAEEADLDVKDIEKNLKKNFNKYNTIIEEDTADGKNLGFTGTPYFLVNDLIIRGAVPLEVFVNAYDFVLKNNVKK